MVQVGRGEVPVERRPPAANRVRPEQPAPEDEERRRQARASGTAARRRPAIDIRSGAGRRFARPQTFHGPGRRVPANPIGGRLSRPGSGSPAAPARPAATTSRSGSPGAAIAAISTAKPSAASARAIRTDREYGAAGPPTSTTARGVTTASPSAARIPRAAPPPGPPTSMAPRPPEGAPPIAARSSVRGAKIDRIASAIAAGSVGSQTTPQPVSRRSAPSRAGPTRPPARPPPSPRTACWASSSRWLSVEGWIGIATTSAAATQSSSSSGGTAGRIRTRPVRVAVGSPPLQFGLQVAVAEQHEDGRSRDGRDRLDQLLDAAVGARPPW